MTISRLKSLLKIKALYAFLITLLFCKSLSAQRTHSGISGTIMSSEGKPLTNVQVADTFSKVSVLSKENGGFNIPVQRDFVVLKFVYLGYETRYLSIRLPSAPVQVVLNEKSLNLETVEISANADLAYKRTSAYINDFDFFENGILLLLEENGKSHLRLIDNYESTISDLEIKKEALSLFRDCLNNIQLLCKDSVYQVQFEKNKIQLANACSLNEFNNLLRPCLGTIGENFYFAQFSSYNQSVLYYSINKNNHQKKSLYSVSNNSAIDYTRSFAAKNASDLAVSAHPMGDNNYQQQKFLRKAEADKLFLENILLKEINSPLFILNDSVFIFNHVLDSALVFSPAGLLSRSFALHYKAHSGEKSEVIADNNARHLFIANRTSAIITIEEIDLNSGKTFNKKKLTGYLFPEKLKVKDGKLYFVYRNKEGGNFNYLYRKKID